MRAFLDNKSCEKIDKIIKDRIAEDQEFNNKRNDRIVKPTTCLKQPYGETKELENLET